MYIVAITYMNGSTDNHVFDTFSEASEFCRTGISYSGGRVKRVMLDERAMWDISWDELSKRAGLARNGLGG